jgi:two-component system OmpR family response regulator
MRQRRSVVDVRVLVVEDDQSMAASLKRGLAAEGYVVEVADNGEEGLWMATEGHYDVVVLDIMIPKKNGFVVLSELRQSGCGTPVLMLTAKSGEWDQAEALDSGADDFLSKPFSYPVLLARLRALIRRGATGSAATLTVGRLELDTATRRCVCDGTVIDLTAREFALLEYLMLRPGVVVGKSELLHHVWDIAHDGETNVVEVYVGYVRRKLQSAGGGPVVETVRGAGYRLVDDGR